jgi:hypothetical protein
MSTYVHFNIDDLFLWMQEIVTLSELQSELQNEAERTENQISMDYEHKYEVWTSKYVLCLEETLTQHLEIVIRNFRSGIRYFKAQTVVVSVTILVFVTWL